MFSEHFRLEELVDPQLHKALGERCWELLDLDAVKALDQLRDRFGPIVVNNWHSRGSTFLTTIYRESGLRRADSGTGSPRSQHKAGTAFDCKFRDYEPDEVFNYILGNQHLFPLIRRLEHVDHTPTWLHFDRKPHNHDGIYVFRP